MYNHRSLLLLALMAIASSLGAADPNTLTSAEKAAGWRSLFDGRSLDGWRGYKTEAPGPGWIVRDGAIVLTPVKSGDLVTKEVFADFELSFEWNISEGGNSGVVYRAGLGDRAPHQTGPEYQVLDNANAKDNVIGNHLAGSLYDLGPEVPRDLARPAGQWNLSRIVVRGWHVEHWLNGQRVAAVDLRSEDGKAWIAKSKFKGWPKFASLPAGHITLQDHGNAAAFRAIKIREMK